mgnify:CR=1 FL=1
MNMPCQGISLILRYFRSIYLGNYPFGMNSNLDYLIEQFIDNGCDLDVTDIDGDFNNVTFNHCDYHQGRYHFKHETDEGTIVIISSDEDTLIRVKNHLNSDAEVVRSEKEPDSEEPNIVDNTIQYRGILVEKSVISCDEQDFCPKLENLSIVLYYNYNASDLTRVLSMPCPVMSITGGNDDVVIRGPVFSQCKAESLHFENVSLNREARESIPYVEELTIVLDDYTTGFNGVNAENLNIDIYDEMDRYYCINGNVKKVSVFGSLARVIIRSDTVVSVDSNGHKDRPIALTISGCTNLDDLIVNNTDLTIDVESQQNVTKFCGDAELCKTFPRIKDLSTSNLEYDFDLSNIRSLILTPKENVDYIGALLSAEHLEKLRVRGTLDDKWNELFIDLLKKGTIRDINLPEGIDMNDYPSVVFMSKGKGVAKHNELAKKRSKLLADVV